MTERERIGFVDQAATVLRHRWLCAGVDYAVARSEAQIFSLTAIKLMGPLIAGRERRARGLETVEEKTAQDAIDQRRASKKVRGHYTTRTKG